ncbi:MAG: HD domain-containing protein [Nitrospirota bacterium]|nr:MAG: HD domain-containing protein [Nitrospirota bacterium]
MLKEVRVQLFDMIMCLSNALDLVNKDVVDHHKRVAYIATSIAAEAGLSKDDQNDIFMAGAMHDIGAITLAEKLKLKHYNLEFAQSHAELGYILLKDFKPFSKIASVIRYHHIPWDNGKGKDHKGEKVPLAAHILHIADRIEVQIDRSKDVLGQVGRITDQIRKDSGGKFIPQLVDAFLRVSGREYFWFDCTIPHLASVLSRSYKVVTMELDHKQLLNMARLFSQIVDFRSRFTATHSSGVATNAESLARLSSFSSDDCEKMLIAGYLHDLGKLAVPAEILDKKGPLTMDELHIVRAHTYHTYRILENIDHLYDINVWGAFHHERLDGSGYPFHQTGEDMPLGARIMAVADVLTATTEDRPYRAGMKKEQVVGILKQMGTKGLLDNNISLLAIDNYDELNEARMVSQSSTSREFEGFWHKLTEIMMED